ncbi:MAG: WhiB family transcriptional regulator [Acidimicrobiales bacterium]
MARAACRGEPVDTFFPQRGQSSRRAKELCAGCPRAVGPPQLRPRDRRHGRGVGRNGRAAVVGCSGTMGQTSKPRRAERGVWNPYADGYLRRTMRTPFRYGR